MSDHRYEQIKRLWRGCLWGDGEVRVAHPARLAQVQRIGVRCERLIWRAYQERKQRPSGSGLGWPKADIDRANANFDYVHGIHDGGLR